MDVKADELGMGVGNHGEGRVARRDARTSASTAEASEREQEKESKRVTELASQLDPRVGLIATALGAEKPSGVSGTLDPSVADAQAFLTASQILARPEEARAAQANLAPQSALSLLRD